MNIKAIKVVQPLGEFYIAKIKARDLLKISTSQVARYDKNGNVTGNQRPIKSDRLKAIAKFIQSEEMSFPTSIIVAANVNGNGIIYDDEERRWKIKPILADVYELEIPENCISSLIIDGQHRLKAFEENTLDDSYRDIELVCSIFFDLPGSYQAYLFATINGNQKRVDKSLALELFGINLDNESQNTWSPEKLAVYITRRFNFTKDSPLEGKIRLAPLCDVGTDKSKWLLSTAAMVEGITKLISSNPQRDRDELVRKRKNIFEDKSRRVLREISDKSVLRELYLETKDEEIYLKLYNYFSSVNDLLWVNADANSIINKTIGISALFDILKALLEKDKSISNFDEYIQKIIHIPYTDNYFSLSGKGKSRLKRVMKYHLGLNTMHDLQEDDVEHL